MCFSFNSYYHQWFLLLLSSSYILCLLQPDTVPQGVVDMNKCTDVKDASGSTSHQNSLSIVTPDKTTYIKANSKEEIQWYVALDVNRLIPEYAQV